ncbi:MAG: hypothetical protein R3D02_05940 [Hyphomicrobiales bacterium]
MGEGEAPASRTAEIRRLAAVDPEAARAGLARLLADRFGLAATAIEFNVDKYSLNSLNGFFSAGGEAFFFKFHQEEGEEAGRGEYYRAAILSDAGLPVDRPVHVAALPGEQILVYRRRRDIRFSDLLYRLDEADDAALRATAVAAEARLMDEVLAVYRRSLHPISPEASAAEPIHRLFHDRLVDAPGACRPGGRLARFYLGKRFAFPGLEIDWTELAALPFVINGRRYERTLGELFAEAAERLAPERLADAGGVVAHGDAHNANVWFAGKGDAAGLVFFDPAFAGASVPTLLAEIKATFHNVFAHPFWLYDPARARATFAASARRDGDCLHVGTDWALTAIRRDILAVKATRLWRPLLAGLKARALLPADWRRVVRLALFLCPTMVMNLRAGVAGHDPVSSLIGLSVAVMVGSAPKAGEDAMTRFLDAVDPELAVEEDI